MIYPSFDQVRVLARSYSFIPICHAIFADTETPIRLYSRVRHRPYSFLLESAEGEQAGARYSFVGADPFLLFTCREGLVTLSGSNGSHQTATADPFNDLTQLLERYRAPNYPGYPPFLGGAVGYVGYEAIRYFTPIKRRSTEEESLAKDLQLLFCDRLWVFDHLKQEILVVIGLHVPSGADEALLREAYNQVVQEIRAEVEKLQALPPDLPPLLPALDQEDASYFSRAPSNLTAEQYKKMLQRAKGSIAADEVSQVVLSQRWTWQSAPAPFTVYRLLRTSNPSPYLFCLSMGEEAVVGASPELLIRVREGEVTTRPIAGTRPRGRDHVEDERLACELQTDPKELAEHRMLLGLGRAEIERVSIPGSVQITQHMKLERFSHVMHLVSQVTGRLAEEHTPLDAFRACFPAGTVSGLPKQRAMELIADLEPVQRGTYGGAVGYFSFAGNLDTCITIRTAHFRNGEALIQAGGGIVADSQAVTEYQETKNKAKAVLRALGLAEEMEKEEEAHGARLFIQSS